MPDAGRWCGGRGTRTPEAARGLVRRFQATVSAAATRFRSTSWLSSPSKVINACADRNAGVSDCNRKAAVVRSPCPSFEFAMARIAFVVAVGQTQPELAQIAAADLLAALQAEGRAERSSAIDQDKLQRRNLRCQNCCRLILFASRLVAAGARNNQRRSRSRRALERARHCLEQRAVRQE